MLDTLPSSGQVAANGSITFSLFKYIILFHKDTVLREDLSNTSKTNKVTFHKIYPSSSIDLFVCMHLLISLNWKNVFQEFSFIFG